ncbi:MAG: ATP-dependent Clp protease proteolytic subunit [Dongiaceae bacterium]
MNESSPFTVAAALSTRPARRAHISFSAEINPMTTDGLISLLARLVNDGFNDVHLLISTAGGSVMNGVNLYSLLRALPIHLTTHNVGNVDSIGNAIFLAGQERYACPHSTFSFHGVGLDIAQRCRLEEAKIREHLNSILNEQRRIGSIIRERTRLSEQQIRKLFRETQAKEAEWAKRVGIVHDVRNATIAPGAPIHALAFPH